jgi:hypothetical protein
VDTERLAATANRDFDDIINGLLSFRLEVSQQVNFGLAWDVVVHWINHDIIRLLFDVVDCHGSADVLQNNHTLLLNPNADRPKVQLP